jgi:hypothetical protein
LLPEAQRIIKTLGKRPRKERVRAAIEALCCIYEWVSPADLSHWLNFSSGKLTERHLSPMVEAGQLERRYPDNLTHPDQAYRAKARQLPLDFLPEDRT